MNVVFEWVDVPELPSMADCSVLFRLIMAGEEPRVAGVIGLLYTLPLLPLPEQK